MIQLSDMHLARELVRQQVIVNVTTDYEMPPLSPGGVLPRRLVQNIDLNVNDLIRGMREDFDDRNLEAWWEGYDAILRVMTDDQLNDWRLLSITWGRLSGRLMDRIVQAAGRAERGGATDEGSKILGSIVESTGCAIDSFRSVIGYVAGRRSLRKNIWMTRFKTHLPCDSGPAEEREAYDAANFTPRERARLDRWFEKKMPPLGARFTLATLALDMMDRYRQTSPLAMKWACKKATSVLDFAIGLNDL